MSVESKYQELFNQEAGFWDCAPALVVIGILVWLWVKADPNN